MAKVLLVEDNGDNRTIYRAILQHAGHVVVEAVNGAEAIPLAPEADVIVMDVSMPVMDGLEATRRLRADERNGHIPIVILTANDQASQARAAMEAGADVYLTKPCLPHLVLEQVERLIS